VYTVEEKRGQKNSSAYLMKCSYDDGELKDPVRAVSDSSCLWLRLFHNTSIPFAVLLFLACLQYGGGITKINPGS
jgi:hypothetical protein